MIHMKKGSVWITKNYPSAPSVGCGNWNARVHVKNVGIAKKLPQRTQRGCGNWRKISRRPGRKFAKKKQAAKPLSNLLEGRASQPVFSAPVDGTIRLGDVLGRELRENAAVHIVGLLRRLNSGKLAVGRPQQTNNLIGVYGRFYQG